MIRAALILLVTLVVFALGRSPVFRVDRAGIAVIGAALAVGTGILSFDEAMRFVDPRTLVILFSMMIVTAELKLSGFFDLTGRWMLRRARSRGALLLWVTLVSGVLSAFCINDIVCLLFTPVVLGACARARLNPVPYLLAVALASNIGSAATLVGNPQNILIAGLSGMSFGAYFLRAAPLALLGLGLTFLALKWRYRSDLAGTLPADVAGSAPVHAYLAGKGVLVLGAVIAGFSLGADMAVTAMLGGAALLVTRRVNPNKIYASVDFNLLVIFAGLFVLIGGVEKSGLMDWVLGRLGGFDFHSLPVFAALTVVFSNLFSNVPAVLLLKYLVPAAGSPPWWTALALFSTLAGNLTLVGSIANLIVAEIARKHGVRLGFFEYLKVGLPLTLILCAASGIYLSFR
jgi:Na+/H+ antiporter NhaD/arsenite permease-like protein